MAAELLDSRGVTTRGAAWRDLISYLDLSIESALTSTSPLHLAVAVLDRRLGKRRLRQLELPTTAPAFVTALLGLRLEAEGLKRHADVG